MPTAIRYTFGSSDGSIGFIIQPLCPDHQLKIEFYKDSKY